MPEEYKIDYTGIQVPDIESIKRTSQQFTDWRRSMGFQTEEERLKEAQERASAAWAELGNSEDAYDWYNALQPDPRKQAKFREDGAKTAGWLMTIPMTIASAGTMGWVPALTTTATGIAGGYGGYKAGEYLDNKLDTKWLAPTLGFAGGMFGGGLGYKGLVKAGNAGLLGTSPYTHLLNGKQNLVYGSQFTKDVVDDVAKSTLNKLKTNGPLRHYLTTRMTPNGSNTEFYETHLYDTLTGKDIGQISTSQFKNQPSTVEHIIGTPLAKGKGRDLYSASWLKNPNGVKSGERLVSPHQTIPTWKHFDYDVLGYHGSHGAAETGGKVVRLKYPERLLPEDAPKIIEYQTNPTLKGSYAWLERPSKLTWEERLGIPKGERNQPVKPRSTRAIEYDIVDGRPTKEFLDDYHAYVEALKTGGSRVDITDMFDSSWYRQRLLNQGLTEEQADQLILRLKDRVSPENLVVVDGLNSVRNFRRIENGIPVEMTPERLTVFGRHTTGPGLSGKSLISLTTKADPEEIILHEIGGHRSQPLVADFKDTYLDQALTSLGLKRHMKIGETTDYGLNWGEVRARALTIAKQMSDAGWNPNSPEQVNVWLNKHIFTNSPKNVNQGALYYDRPRFIKAVTTGLKQGGKIENPDY